MKTAPWVEPASTEYGNEREGDLETRRVEEEIEPRLDVAFFEIDERVVDEVDARGRREPARRLPGMRSTGISGRTTNSRRAAARRLEYPPPLSAPGMRKSPTGRPCFENAPPGPGESPEPGRSCYSTGSARLAERRRIENTALRPELVVAAREADGRLGADVALVDLAIVAHALDDVDRPSPSADRACCRSRLPGRAGA